MANVAQCTLSNKVEFDTFDVVQIKFDKKAIAPPFLTKSIELNMLNFGDKVEHVEMDSVAGVCMDQTQSRKFINNNDDRFYQFSVHHQRCMCDKPWNIISDGQKLTFKKLTLS